MKHAHLTAVPHTRSMKNKVKKDKKTLLLVEDEALTAMAEQKQLERAGYKVDTALTGEEALEKVKKDETIDLILMDIDLGQGIDGTEAAEIILEEKDIPIVFLSSHTEPEIVDKTEKITSYGYVVKNSGATVLDASIKMAFRLFDEKQNVKKHEEKLESAYEELQGANEELIQANEQLEETQGEILKREEELRESETRYRSLFETATDAISIFKNGACVDCNQATVDMLGCDDKSDIIGESPWDFSPPLQPDGRDSREKALSLIESALKGEIQYFEWKQKKKDGTCFDVEVSLNAIELRGETYVQAITRDVTERKAAQLRFETIFHMSLDMICIASLSDATFQQVNPAFTRVLGYSEEELLRRPFLDFIHPDDLKPTIDILEDELKKGKKVMRFENRYRTKNGDYRWLDWTSHPIADQDLTYAIAHDITERKKAEKILSESEARLKSIFRAAPIGIGLVSNRKFLDVNEHFCEITGFSRDELIGQNARMIYPSDEDYEYVGSEKYRQISEKGTGTVETRIRRKDGVICDIIMSSTPLDPSDLSAGVTFTALDITERKQAEEALRESEERLRNVVENMPVLMDALDDNNTVIAWNRECERVTGYSADEMIGNPKSLELLYPDREYRKKMLSELTELGFTFRDKEYTVTCKDGSEKSISWSNISSQFPIPGWETWAIGMDVTARKKAQERIAESENMYRMLVESTNSFVFSLDREGRFTYVNRFWSEKLGYSPEKIVGRNGSALIDPEYVEAVKESFNEVLKGRFVENFEFRSRTKDGGFLDVMVNLNPVLGSDGEVTHILGTGIDITERNLADRKLLEATALLETAIAQSPSGILIADAPDVTIRMANPAAFGIRGGKSEILTGIDVQQHTAKWQTYYLDGTPYKPENLPLSRAVLDGETVHNEEVIIRDDEGTDHIVSANAAPIRDDRGRITAGIVVFHDVTERKKSEEKIQSLLDGKNLLLKEVHHRIKNNMITMKNLLNLQAGSLHDDAAREALETAEKRMTSMMVLYDKLYQDDVIDEISTREYLTSLVDEIVKTSPVFVSTSLDITDMMVPVKKAFPLGIIVNELISNAIKYAFTESGDNKLQVSLSGTDNGARLIVHDNGKGFDADTNTEGFGLELVNALAKQLHGNFTIERNSGTTCVLDVKL